MNSFFNIDDAKVKIGLPDGARLILLDRLAKEVIYGPLECARNIFLIDKDEKVIWQVSTDFDSNGGSFTSLYIDEDVIKGYRWDGGVYVISLSNGKGVPAQLVK